MSLEYQVYNSRYLLIKLKKFSKIVKYNYSLKKNGFEFII